MTLQEKLKQIRQWTGKSQEKLAAELGVSFPTFNSWINGRSVPRKKAQTQIDDLYRRITGQNVIPADQLQAKKLFLLQRKKEHSHVLQKILKHPDILDQFVLSLTYNTNSIEGSSLTEPETAAILFENAALPDKTIIEQMEVKNHQAALQYLFRHLQERGRLDEIFILKLHGILLNGIQEDAGRYRSHGVRIVGSNVPTANHLKVPDLMKKLAVEIQRKSKDVIAHAAWIHSHFEQIHPFSDGNGRIGRLLLTAMLLRENFPPAIIRQDKRRFYLLYLNKSQLQQDFSLLDDFVCDAIFEAFDILEEKNV